MMKIQLQYQSEKYVKLCQQYATYDMNKVSLIFFFIVWLYNKFLMPLN